MAWSDAERSFAAKARAEGYDDAEIVAHIKARRGRDSEQMSANSPYKPTDYADEAAKLPAPQLTPGEAAGIPQPRDDSGENAFTRFMHRALPETRRYRDAATGGDAPAPGDPIAHDPTAQAVLAGVLGAGAGTLVGGAARPILSGAVNSATQTAVQGGDLEDIGKGALVGAAIPAAGRAAGAVARRIRGGEGGQARALWEKHGGNVGPLDSGSGVDEIAGMEPTRANVGKASAIGARNIRAGLADQMERDVSGPYREARQAVDYSPAAKEWADVSSLIQTVGELPEALRPAIKRELKDLGAVMAPDGRVMMTQADLNTARQRLSDLANYGLNSGPGTGVIKDQSFKALANAAKVLVDEGPYAQANDIYERGMNMHAVDRADLGLRKRPARLESGRATEDAKVAQILRNRSNDSEAAGAMAERADVPVFVARHPELERQADLPDLIRAKGKLQFGLDTGKTDNLIQKAEHIGALRHWLEVMGHNTSAAAGRLAYRPAGLGLTAEDILASPQMNQIIAAYQAQQQRDADRAAALVR